MFSWCYSFLSPDIYLIHKRDSYCLTNRGPAGLLCFNDILLFLFFEGDGDILLGDGALCANKFENPTDN